MYFKKEIIISFFMITISASNLYMPMIWLYVFLLDFLIPFLCDPDLQCRQCVPVGGGGEGGGVWVIYKLQYSTFTQTKVCGQSRGVCTP
jgi:hypothetical protein